MFYSLKLFFKLDTETKKAREAAKVEQWETERKRVSKHLVPKCFFVDNYWKLSQTGIPNSIAQNIKFLEKFKVSLNYD